MINVRNSTLAGSTWKGGNYSWLPTCFIHIKDICVSLFLSLWSMA